MTDCKACTTAASSPTCGLYNAHCLRCCARLVASARPLRHAQEAMLAAIARDPLAPGRDEVLECVRRMSERRA